MYVELEQFLKVFDDHSLNKLFWLFAFQNSGSDLCQNIYKILKLFFIWVVIGKVDKDLCGGERIKYLNTPNTILPSKDQNF